MRGVSSGLVGVPKCARLGQPRLTAMLNDVMDELGQGKNAARALGIDCKTLWAMQEYEKAVRCAGTVVADAGPQSDSGGVEPDWLRRVLTCRLLKPAPAPSSGPELRLLLKRS